VIQKEYWQELAHELGFEWKEGIRAFTDSPNLLSMVGEEMQLWRNVEQKARVLDNPILAKLAAVMLPGVVEGIWRRFSVFLFPFTRSSRTSVSRYRTQTGYEYLYIVLLFKEPYEWDFRIEGGSGCLGGLFKRLLPGAFVRLPDNPALDALISATSGNREDLARLISREAVQAGLLALFEYTRAVRINHYGIRFVSMQRTMEVNEARALLDLMADLSTAMEA
jgi:hypothetical protein